MEDDCCGLGVGLICFNEQQKKFTRNRKNTGLFFFSFLGGGGGGIKEN